MYIIITSHSLRKDSGVTNVIVGLANELQMQGIKFSVLIYEAVEPQILQRFSNSSVVLSANTDSSQLAKVYSFICTLKKQIYLHKSADKIIVHDHGIWKISNILSLIIAKYYQCYLIISIHGMLSRWAIRHRPLRKKIAMKIYQKKIFNLADGLLTTSSIEKKDVYEVVRHSNIGVIPNGIEFPGSISLIASAAPKSQKRSLLFLSRVHPVKGLDILIAAWSQLQPSNWNLWIAGPDEDGYLFEVKMMVEKYGLNKSIFFLGPISESQKPQLFSTSHLFILPSYSENFGLVVAEALSYGIPVITTLNTPWINLERDGCGWCIEANLNSLVNTLKLALSLDDDVLSLMGDNARSLAHSFAWSKIVPQYQLFYKSL